MKRLKLKFVNLQEMVSFVKKYKVVIHNYDRESQILELYTEENLEKNVERYRGKILSIEYTIPSGSMNTRNR